MRFFSLIVCICLFSVTAVADRGALESAKSKGATATFRLTIVNDQGAPVENVTGGATFWNHRTNKTDSTKSTSDENGKITLSGRSFYDGGFYLKKDGYYRTKKDYIFYKDSYDCVEETLFTRKWVPDYIKTEVLKKKRNPIPMYAHSLYNKPIPAFETPLGFDFQVADWIKPHGEGIVTDVTITVNATEVPFGKKTRSQVTKVTFNFPNKYDGVQIHTADKWSEFISAYSVDLTKPFQQQLVLLPGKTDYDWFDHSKYLVFRVRSEISPSGELINCHYGKIYPFIKFTGKELMIKSIVFNPNPNDTNLEFNPKQNLTDKNSYSGTTLKQSTP